MSSTKSPMSSSETSTSTSGRSGSIGKGTPHDPIVSAHLHAESCTDSTGGDSVQLPWSGLNVRYSRIANGCAPRRSNAAHARPTTASTSGGTTSDAMAGARRGGGGGGGRGGG